MVVPGSAKTVYLLNGKSTVVVAGEKTIEIVPDIRVVTKTDTVFQTSTINGGQIVTQTVTSPLQGQCTREPVRKWGHGKGEWDYDEWDNDDDIWDNIDHSGHHHGPDEKCNEYNDYDEWKQYQIDHAGYYHEPIEEWMA